jgi:hypothetical protein
MIGGKELLTENPALRLHFLLEQTYFKNVNNPNESFRSAWAKTFNIDERNTAGFLEQFGNLFNLYMETRKCILDNDRLNNQKNSEYLARIGRSVSLINLEGTMAQFVNSINPEILTALYYMSESLSFAYSFTQNDVIDTEQLDQLVNDVDELIYNIGDSGLPVDVKVILVKNLNKIRESLQFYRISGIEGVRVALEQSIGSVLMNHSEILKENEDENVRNVFGLFGKLNDFFSSINGAKDLLGPVIKIFLD